MDEGGKGMYPGLMQEFDGVEATSVEEAAALLRGATNAVILVEQQIHALNRDLDALTEQVEVLRKERRRAEHRLKISALAGGGDV